MQHPNQQQPLKPIDKLFAAVMNYGPLVVLLAFPPLLAWLALWVTGAVFLFSCIQQFGRGVREAGGWRDKNSVARQSPDPAPRLQC